MRGALLAVIQIPTGRRNKEGCLLKSGSLLRFALGIEPICSHGKEKKNENGLQ
jgi:hypothetical protein